MESTTNCLYHFKREKEYLLDILSDFTFTPRYVSETVILKYENGSKVININCPMVCYCDIPLERINHHMERYGFYGIGITKSWAAKNCINPIIYVVPNTGLANSIHDLIIHLDLLGERMNKNQDLKNNLSSITGPLFQAFNIVTQYLKPYSYQGLENHQEKRKFYDEKEWRYIPEAKDSLSYRQIPTKNRESSINNTEQEHLKYYRLEFESEDIDTIIIRDEKERSEFVSKITNTLKIKNKSQFLDETINKIKTNKEILKSF